MWVEACCNRGEFRRISLVVQSYSRGIAMSLKDGINKSNEQRRKLKKESGIEEGADEVDWGRCGEARRSRKWMYRGGGGGKRICTEASLRGAIEPAVLNVPWQQFSSSKRQ
jgi:hypothetical protein